MYSVRHALAHGLLGTTLCLLPAIAAAGSDWRACVDIEADRERLACFDRLAAQKPAVKERPHQAASKSPERESAGREDDDAAENTLPLISTVDKKAPVALEQRLRSEESGEHNPFVMRGYNPNYMMPATYTPTDLGRPVYDFDPQHAETKFQISFQFNWLDEPLGDGTALYFGYTQLSLWQTYNTELLGGEEDASSPFRETNYEPEIGLSIDTDYRLAGLSFKRARLSLIHTSNGQGGDRSRSWNRLAAGVAFGRGNFAGRLRGWYRLPEGTEDDNPDMTDYMGYGDLVLAYKWNRQTFSATLRNNLQIDSNRGAIQLDYTFPLNKRVKGYVQYFNGYGESLIDYNRSVSRIGMGIALTDWL